MSLLGHCPLKMGILYELAVFHDSHNIATLEPMNGWSSWNDAQSNFLPENMVMRCLMIKIHRGISRCGSHLCWCLIKSAYMELKPSCLFLLLNSGWPCLSLTSLTIESSMTHFTIIIVLYKLLFNCCTYYSLKSNHKAIIVEENRCLWTMECTFFILSV